MGFFFLGGGRRCQVRSVYVVVIFVGVLLMWFGGGGLLGFWGFGFFSFFLLFRAIKNV